MGNHDLMAGHDFDPTQSIPFLKDIGAYLTKLPFISLLVFLTLENCDNMRGTI